MLKKIYKFCKITIQSSPLYFLLNLLMVFGIVFLQLGMSYMFKLMTNVVVNSGRNASTLEVALPIILFFFCITFGGNTGNFSNMMKNLYTQNAKKIFRKKFLEVAYQKKQDDFYDKEMYDQYEYVKNHIDETTQISEIIFNELLYGIVSVAIFSVTISIFNPLIFVYILLVSFVMSAVNIYAVRKRVALNEKYKHADRNMAYYDKMFLDKGAAKEIRIYHFGQQILDLWKSKYQEINRNKYQLENKLKTLTLGPELLQSIFTYGLFLYFVLEMSAGKLAIDEFVFLFSIMWGLTGGITFIIKTISGAVLEKYEYIDKYDSYINEQEKAKEGEKLEEFGEIVLDNISYKYKNQTEYALKNISFTLKKGEIVCILGHNGSGKTTLSKVLCGLLEDYQGTLSYNGRNMRDLDQKEYYKKIGIGFQDFTRYSLTLRENVAVGAVENLKNEGAIWDAVEKGNLKELLTELPEGMQTVLGKEYDSGGRELSGGQWQRIILSRAYMGNPDILLLDEPTAAIDPMEEMRLLNRFREIVAGKTAILISHRIGFARLADRIVMMENGKIVENGTHQELLEVKGSYWKMFQEQQKLYERS